MTTRIDLTGIAAGDEARSMLNDWGNVVGCDDDRVFIKFPHKRWIDSYDYKGKRSTYDKFPEIVAVKKKKWEPKEGDYIICTDGDVSRINPGLKETVAVEGRTYPTRELAKKAYSMIRRYQRLIAWILENDPDNDFETGEHTVTHDEEGLYMHYVVEDDISICSPRISSRSVAEKLAHELEQGIIEL